MIREALETGEYGELIRMWSTNKNILRVLISMTYDKKSVISWRAIEAIGVITREISSTEPELVRNLVGRLLWMIRDESGGIGWSSPEILGEIVRNNPDDCSDVAQVITSFHEEEMLCAGVLRAMGRIGEVRKELVLSGIPLLLSYLDSPDPDICGTAAWSLGKIGDKDSKGKLGGLVDDSRVLYIYEDRKLIGRTVGEVASAALGEDRSC
jgi:hypothetical protein